MKILGENRYQQLEDNAVGRAIEIDAMHEACTAIRVYPTAVWRARARHGHRTERQTRPTRSPAGVNAVAVTIGTYCTTRAARQLSLWPAAVPTYERRTRARALSLRRSGVRRFDSISIGRARSPRRAHGPVAIYIHTAAATVQPYRSPVRPCSALEINSILYLLVCFAAVAFCARAAP